MAKNALLIALLVLLVTACGGTFRPHAGQPRPPGGVALLKLRGGPECLAVDGVSSPKRFKRVELLPGQHDITLRWLGADAVLTVNAEGKRVYTLVLERNIGPDGVFRRTYYLVDEQTSARLPGEVTQNVGPEPAVGAAVAGSVEVLKTCPQPEAGGTVASVAAAPVQDFTVTGVFHKSDGSPAAGIEVTVAECDERGRLLGDNAVIQPGRLAFDSPGSGMANELGAVRIPVNASKFRRAPARFLVIVQFPNPNKPNSISMPVLRIERPAPGIVVGNRTEIDLNEELGKIEVPGF